MLYGGNNMTISDNTITPAVIIDPNQTNTNPTPPSPADTPPPKQAQFSTNPMIALMSALQNVSDAMYGIEVSDATLLTYDQNVEMAKTAHWNSFIANYSNQHSKDSDFSSQLSIYETQMSSDVNQLDGITHQQQSSLDTDETNLSKITDIFSSLDTITAFTANLTR